MDNLLVVQVLDTQQDLVHEVPRLRLGDGLASLVELHQRPPAAQLHDDVNEVSVLEVAEQLMERKTKIKETQLLNVSCGHFQYNE